MRRSSESGITLISVVIIGAVAAGLFVFASSAFKGARRSLTTTNQRVVAQSLANELIELFRSMNNDLVMSYLRVNPVGPTLPPYNLCTSVNLLNRTTGQVGSPDPLADLAVSTGAVSGMSRVNRYYRVEVINRVSLQVVRTACGQSPAAYVRSANQSLVVTVGVTWLENAADAPAAFKEFVLTTMLTDG